MSGDKVVKGSAVGSKVSSTVNHANPSTPGSLSPAKKLEPKLLTVWQVVAVRLGLVICVAGLLVGGAALVALSDTSREGDFIQSVFGQFWLRVAEWNALALCGIFNGSFIGLVVCLQALHKHKLAIEQGASNDKKSQ
mmetsp:Transcript_7106/g.8206  ORF Transcript_7106/g.8206 Transcript_7106/m.8206 type:complete len:137 (+) Transcript_7106:299-709(+)